ncbi:MAG: hypothetical protein GC178_10250 [Flavobacteriales bacterium]|nr:hypothetical protein [Flavobacteriales bacterium]
METLIAEESTVTSCKYIKAKDGYAWLNIMPPKPDTLHAKIDVEVPNLGVEAKLVIPNTTDFNDTILFL